ncbi:MAG: DUF6286 domain-containing protein [Dermatophilaceae bacterium]
MTAAKAPVGTGHAPLVGLLLALGLIALGVVGVQEPLVRSGATTGTSWTTWVLTRLDDVSPADWMLVVFVAAVLLGLLLLLVAFRRRPHKTLAVRATTGVYLRTRDLARLADHLLEGIDGVTDVNSSASGSRLTVTATTLEPRTRNSTLSDTLHERLAPCLESFERAPKVSVSIRNGDLT